MQRVQETEQKLEDAEQQCEELPPLRLTPLTTIQKQLSWSFCG